MNFVQILSFFLGEAINPVSGTVAWVEFKVTGSLKNKSSFIHFDYM